MLQNTSSHIILMKVYLHTTVDVKMMRFTHEALIHSCPALLDYVVKMNFVIFPLITSLNVG